MPEEPTNKLFMNRECYGSKNGAGEPVSANPTLPDFIGQSYFDSTAGDFYLATTLAAAGWKKANA